MCGIAGIHRRTNRPVAKAGRLADELLLAIENRGTHSTGYLTMLDDGRVQIQKEVVPASVFVRGRSRFLAESRTVLLHTRFATRGAKVKSNAHPILAGRCAAIHNGTISNDRAVFAKLGVEPKFRVDSEVIPAAISALGWDHAAEALALLDGGMATAVVTSDAPRDLILARLRSYPLVYMVTRDVVIWASTRAAIERAYIRTYGRRPRGRFVEVGDYEVHRIVGSTIEVTKIPHRPYRTRPVVTTPERRASTRPVSGTTAKRRRKRSRRTATSGDRQTALRFDPDGALDYDPVEEEAFVDGVVEQYVRDLMRWGNVDRETAEEMIWG